MWPDRVSNPGPLTYESGALPIALRGPAIFLVDVDIQLTCFTIDSDAKTDYKTFFVLNSTGYEIFSADKYENAN